jgi:hypothetical protein
MDPGMVVIGWRMNRQFSGDWIHTDSEVSDCIVPPTHHGDYPLCRYNQTRPLDHLVKLKRSSMIIVHIETMRLNIS